MIIKKIMIKVNIPAQLYSSFRTEVTMALELCLVLSGFILHTLFSCTLPSSQEVHAQRRVHRETCEDIPVTKSSIKPTGQFYSISLSMTKAQRQG